MYKNAANLYNTLLAIDFNDYNNITDVKKEMMDKKYDPSNLFLKGYKYDEWNKTNEEKSKLQPEETIAERLKLRRQKAGDEDLSDMPPLEGDEEVKEEKTLKILTRSELSIKLPISLAKIKTGNSSNKLKNEIRQILYLFYQHSNEHRKQQKLMNHINLFLTCQKDQIYEVQINKLLFKICLFITRGKI